MKKLLILAGLVGALTAGAVVPAYAEPAEIPPGPGWGNRGDGEGPLHDLMLAAAADLLGLDAAEIQDRLEAGETLAQIAVDQGMTLDEFRTAWFEARQAVFDQAVEDGLIQPWSGRGMNARGRNGAGCPGLEATPSP